MNTGVYGMADAPRAWWLKFKSILEKLGWVESKLERAFFYLYDGGKVCGMGGPHVDDFICTSKGDKFEQCLKKMKDNFSNLTIVTD